MTRAAVFAYHDVGVRCLEVLRTQGVDVGIVVTHGDDPQEEIWFESVAERARQYDIPTIAPQDPNLAESVARIRSTAPDILFSFYYRRMLGPELLALPRLGAYNMHGSLLPKYRGRAPVNWAILNGEQETGATLHEMVAKPDAGRIVDCERVPIGPNDVAREVFDRMTEAAGLILERSLSTLLTGTAKLVPQDLAADNYFDGRRPEDGAIDPAWPAQRVHNLVRAVAPPYPGAYCFIAGKKLRLLRTFSAGEQVAVVGRPALLARGSELYLRCSDGGMLRVTAAEFDGLAFDAGMMRQRLGAESAPLQEKMVAA